VDRTLHCNCGFRPRAENEEALLAEVQHHAWEQHGMALSRDEALVLVFRAELTAAPTTPPDDSPREKEAR
jgi:hypothetical protein